MYYVYVCEYLYAYIEFTQWEVKKMTPLGD